MKKLSLVAVLVASVSVLTGCDPKGAFIGIYQMNGSAVATVQGAPTQTGQLSETIEIRDGDDDEIIVPMNGSSCFIPMKVQGNVAMLRGNSSCSVQNANGLTTTFTFTNGTATLMGSAVSLSVTANMLGTVDAKSITGTMQVNVTLTRLGK